MTFKEWLHEIENFSTRSERLIDDLAGYQSGDEDIVYKWLKAAYDVGYEAGEEIGNDIGFFEGKQ